MKKRVVLQIETPELMESHNLDGRGIVCYLSTKSGTPKILARLHSHSALFGFVSIAFPSGDATFTDPSYIGAANKALKNGRELFRFDSYDEFVAWIPKHRIQ